MVLKIISYIHQVEFESNVDGKKADPAWLPPMLDNGTVVVHLNQTSPTVDITGSLREAGDYVFVVHYYQPNLPGEGLSYPFSFILKYLPASLNIEFTYIIAY